MRGIGFLYLRCAINPRDLWKMFAPYFDDEMEIIPFSDKVPTYVLVEFYLNLNCLIYTDFELQFTPSIWMHDHI